MQGLKSSLLVVLLVGLTLGEISKAADSTVVPPTGSAISSIDDKEMTIALVARNTCSAETLKIVDLLEVELTGSLPVQVLDRTRMTEIFREHALSASGLVNADTALALGRLCGAGLLLNVHEYEGLAKQKYVVFSLFSTASGLKVAQKSMAIAMPEIITKRMTPWIGQVLPELDKAGLSSVAFLGVHSLELGDSLNQHAAHISVMLEETLLSQAGVAVLDLGKLHWLGEERRLQSVVEEKLTLSKSLIRANVEWNTYPDDIRVTVYLSGADQVQKDSKTQIVAVEAIDSELPAFFKEVSASIETTAEIRPLNAKQEAQKLYLLGKSFFEKKRYGQAADYAQTAYHIDPRRREIGKFAYKAQIEDIRRVIYSCVQPGRVKDTDAVNAALRALPKAFDLLISSKDEDESMIWQLSIIQDSQLFGWITSLRGWPEHEETLDGLRDSLYTLTFRAAVEFNTVDKGKYHASGLWAWYSVTDDMSQTLELWNLLVTAAGLMSPQDREELGKAVADIFWTVILQGAPKIKDELGSGGEAWFRQLLRGHEDDLEQFYSQLMQSSYPEFQCHGRIGQARLLRFRKTGQISDSYPELFSGKGGMTEVEYLINLRDNKSGALALTRKLLNDRSYNPKDEMNLIRRWQQLERWDKQRSGDGDPFWNNGRKLFPANSNDAWLLGAATLIDDILWLVGCRRDPKQKTSRMVLMSIDTRTGECEERSSFELIHPNRYFCKRERADLLGNSRLVKLQNSFYYASQYYGIVRLPLNNAPASCMDMAAGMPANECVGVISHQGWIIASFRDQATALVAWHPESGKTNILIHPSKPDLSENGDKSFAISAMTSDPVRNCVWIATKSASHRGWSHTRNIDGVYRIDVSPWRITPATFPRYDGLVRKQTAVNYASSLEATDTSLWFNRNSGSDRWLSYDFKPQAFSDPAMRWLEKHYSQNGPYVKSGHYFFFNKIDFIDTRSGDVHAIAQVPGQDGFNPYPVFLEAAKQGVVIIMRCGPAPYEVWLIDTTKELGFGATQVGKSF